MPVEIDELSSRLGEILARLKVLEDHHDEGEGYKTALFNTIQSQSTAMQALTRDASELNKRLAEVENLIHEYREKRLVDVEKLTDDYRESRDKSRGVAEAMKGLYALVGFIGALLTSIAVWFGLTHGK